MYKEKKTVSTGLYDVGELTKESSWKTVCSV